MSECLKKWKCIQQKQKRPEEVRRNSIWNLSFNTGPHMPLRNIGQAPRKKWLGVQQKSQEQRKPQIWKLPMSKRRLKPFKLIEPWKEPMPGGKGKLETKK